MNVSEKVRNFSERKLVECDRKLNKLKRKRKLIELLHNNNNDGCAGFSFTSG